MRRPNLPDSVWISSRRKASISCTIRASACSGCPAATNDGRRALANVAQEGELTHHQDFSTYIDQRAIHQPPVIRENAEPAYLFSPQLRPPRSHRCLLRRQGGEARRQYAPQSRRQPRLCYGRPFGARLSSSPIVTGWELLMDRFVSPGRSPTCAVPRQASPQRSWDRLVAPRLTGTPIPQRARSQAPARPKLPQGSRHHDVVSSARRSPPTGPVWVETLEGSVCAAAPVVARESVQAAARASAAAAPLVPPFF